MAEIPEKDFLTPAKEKGEDFDVFDFLEKLGFESDKIDQAAIERFRNSRVKESLRKIFDESSAENKILSVALDSLPEAEFKKLKAIAISKDCTLPGIHNIRAKFSAICLLTGDDKFLLERVK